MLIVVKSPLENHSLTGRHVYFSCGFSRVMVVGCNFLVPLAMPFTLHDKSQFQNDESISFGGGRFLLYLLKKYEGPRVQVFFD